MLPSLRSRLVAAGLALTATATLATGLVVAATTSRELISAQRDLAEQQQDVVQRLTSYAVLQGTWDGVEALVESLATETGTRIVLTTIDGAQLADTQPPGASADLVTNTVIDPTNSLLDSSLDPQLVEEITALNDAAAACLDQAGVTYRIQTDSIGLPYIETESETANEDVVMGCYDSAEAQMSFPSGFAVTQIIDGEVADAAIVFMGVSPPPVVSWWLVAATAVVVGLILALVTWWFSARLVRPIEQLSVAAERIRSGDLSTRVAAPAAPAELATLGRSFNAMATELDEVAERRRRFTSDVAHELRTPLTNVTAHVQAIADGVATPSEALPVVSGEIEHVSRLVDDLLQLSLLDDDRLAMESFEVVIGDVVAQVMAANRARAESAGVALVETGDAPEPAEIDPLRIRQAIDNLVANAIRHTPDGGRVTIDLAQSDAATTIRVTDTGPGIPEDFLPQMFQRFARADSSRSRDTGGTGLGLSISHGITAMHGGVLAAENVPDGGARLTMTLPRTPSRRE